MFWDQLATLGVWGIIIEVVLIIFFKIIEVSIGTVRSILVVKGYRQFAAILAILKSCFGSSSSRVIHQSSRRSSKGDCLPLHRLCCGGVSWELY